MYAFRSIYFDAAPREGRIVDLFDTCKPSREVALFFVHGGGWRNGSRSIFHSIIHEYSRQGFDCASTDYRLKDANIFDQVSDVRTALDIFVEDLRERNRPSRVLLVGSSAGAHLALLTAFAQYEAQAKSVHLSIAGVAVQAAPFTFEPWDDIFPAAWNAMQSAVGQEYSGHEELFRRASPQHYIRPGMPPLFALHAENEHMFPRELYQRFAAISIAMGNDVCEKIYPRTEHGFFYSLERWQQREAFEDIIVFAESLPTRNGNHLKVSDATVSVPPITLTRTALQPAHNG
jgi:acetyl esterase/lipase